VHNGTADPVGFKEPYPVVQHGKGGGVVNEALCGDHRVLPCIWVQHQYVVEGEV
jgi:hypothetical protein